MLLFFPNPPQERAFEGENARVIIAYLLLKQAGQLVFSKHDIELVCRDFAGYTMQYDQTTETFVLKLVTRPEEYPRTVDA